MAGNKQVINPYQLSKETMDRMNFALKEVYGTDVVTGLQIFRVVWSDDQLEKRLMEVTDAGVHLLVPEVREVRKYWHWIRERYLLERLVLVPEHQQTELAGLKISYENIWTFENSVGFVPPKLEIACLIVDTVLSAQAVQKAMITGGEKVDRPLSRYVDPEGTTEGEIYAKKKRIDSYVEELFGDQSSLGGSTYVTRDAIIVPRNFERTK